MRRLARAPALLLAVAIGCQGNDTSLDDDPGPFEVPDGCQPLASEVSCALPFPSDFFRVDEGGAPRLLLRGAAIPRTTKGHPADVLGSFRVDGASRVPTIVAALPAEVVPDGLPNITDDPSRSVADDSPTFLLDASGKRIPHYVDLDPRPDDPLRRAIVMRPFDMLAPQTRFVAVLRGVRTANGLAPPPRGFKRLRDARAERIAQTPLAPFSRYERDVFPVLAAARISRSDVQLAWDFTTGSREAPIADMARIRDATIAWLAANVPAVEVTATKEDDGNVFRWVRGTFTVPLFLDRDGPGARLARDAAGAPRQSGVGKAKFLALVPQALRGKTGRLVGFGHGFFGSIDSAFDAGDSRQVANELGAVLVGTDFIGFSTDDLKVLLDGIANVPGEGFAVVERAHQAMANWIVLGALAASPTGLAATNSLRGLFAPAPLQYYFASTSAILGGTLATLDPRGEAPTGQWVLQVGGAGFSHMMSRSAPFGLLDVFLRATMTDALDKTAVLATLPAALDRVDPASYVHLFGAQRVLMQIATGDVAVPNATSWLYARARGLARTRPSIDVPNIPDADPTTLRSALSIFDYGVDPAAAREPAPPPDNGGHTKTRVSRATLRQIDAFFRDGSIIHPCEGLCDPE